MRCIYLYCLLIFSLLLPFAALQADEPLYLVFTEDFKQGDSTLQIAIADSERLASLSELLDELFILEQPIEIVFGAADGPLFDPELSQIWMPASFIGDIKQRFDAAYELSGEDERLEIIEDVLLHTLVHELAHALIAQYDLPIQGREEDAADALGSLILIEYLEDGQAVALTAADMFALESQDRLELDESDFWAEHSLDLQRYYSTLCHVYGSEPEAFEELLLEEGLGDERASQCEDEYARLVDGWLQLLGPHMVEH